MTFFSFTDVALTKDSIGAVCKQEFEQSPERYMGCCQSLIQANAFVTLQSFIHK
jgi:hypothetical protein